jgi:threonine/homoserine/homoserine lactone efflux protein
VTRQTATVSRSAARMVHVASCAVVYTAVGTGARRRLRPRPAAALVLTRISAAAMVLIGVALLAERSSGNGRAGAKEADSCVSTPGSYPSG